MIAANATVFDVSLPLSPDLCVWHGGPAIQVDPASWISAGSVANVSRLTCASHTGTHVDAPWHFVDDGKKLDQISPQRWSGRCWVVAFADDVIRIEPDRLDDAGIPDGTERLILKTSNSRFWNQHPLRITDGYVGLSPEAVQWVIERGIGLVGSGYLSIDSYQGPGHLTHLVLLGNEILILEGLTLSEVTPGAYVLLCLRLRLTVGDGAPARALPARP